MTGAFGSLSLIPFMEEVRRHMIQRGRYWEDAASPPPSASQAAAPSDNGAVTRAETELIRGAVAASLAQQPAQRRLEAVEVRQKELDRKYGALVAKADAQVGGGSFARIIHEHHRAVTSYAPTIMNVNNPG